jgi:abortive infection bacteriophage resistance protein
MAPQYSKSPLSCSEQLNLFAYFVLSMILYFLQTVNPKNTFVLKFRRLLEKYPNIDIKATGFLPDWEQEPLWRQNLDRN